MTTDITKRRRVREVLYRNRLMFVQVGGRAGEDRIIAERETDGRRNPVHSELVRQLVEACR